MLPLRDRILLVRDWANTEDVVANPRLNPLKTVEGRLMARDNSSSTLAADIYSRPKKVSPGYWSKRTQFSLEEVNQLKLLDPLHALKYPTFDWVLCRLISTIDGISTTDLAALEPVKTPL